MHRYFCSCAQLLTLYTQTHTHTYTHEDASSASIARWRLSYEISSCRRETKKRISLEGFCLGNEYTQTHTKDLIREKSNFDERTTTFSSYSYLIFVSRRRKLEVEGKSKLTSFLFVEVYSSTKDMPKLLTRSLMFT